MYQVWVGEINQYMVTTEETAGKTVKLWGITDIDNIDPLGEYLGGSLLAHNAFFHDSRIYIAHYESGLKVLDYSDPDNLVEVGFYDTYLSGEGAGFNGARESIPGRRIKW